MIRVPAAALLSALIVACGGAPGPTLAPGQTAGPGTTGGPTSPGATLAPGTTATPSSGQPTDALDTPLLDGRHLGGTVSGLQGSGFVIYALAEELAITADGPFQFAQPLPDGAIYAIRVITQPEESRPVVPDRGRRRHDRRRGRE